MQYAYMCYFSSSSLNAWIEIAAISTISTIQHLQHYHQSTFYNNNMTVTMAATIKAGTAMYQQQQQNAFLGLLGKVRSK